MRRFYHTTIVLCSVLVATACTSIYEVGEDLSKEYSIEAVTAGNTAADDLAPHAAAQGLYITSNIDVDGENLDRLYLIPWTANSAAERVPVSVTGQSEKSGALVLLPDGESVVFAQCYREDAVGDCDLLRGRLDASGGSIVDVQMLYEPLNDFEWDQHPTMTADGLMLLFASERFGGEGGSDIWQSNYKNGKWTRPFNLGSTINTSGEEISPFLSPDGKTLYFASDTHPGMGGFDLYQSHFSKDGWSKPEVLGKPFNSQFDDVFLNGMHDADTSYLASNRTGGLGGYDIYRIVKKKEPPPPPVVKEKRIVLRVIAKNAFTREPVAANISVSFDGESLLLAEGTGEVEVSMQMDRIYNLTATHSGYENAVENLRTGGREDIKRIARDEGDKMVLMHEISLVPITEEERKIYAFTVEFDFNLFNIRPEEERKLDSAAILLEQFPYSTVVISGYTDSVGSHTYNIKLGYNRAKEVSEYVSTWLRRKNVKLRNAIELRTYGEGEPVATNSTDEGRQRNRRVEIAIVRNR